MSSKTYKSKLGLEFGITKYHRPAEKEVVFFTEEEWVYLKDQNLNPHEFKVIWDLRRDDHRSPIIPEESLTEAAARAKKYVTLIKQKILRGTDVEEESEAKIRQQKDEGRGC